MQNTIRVEVVPTTVPADDEAVERAQRGLEAARISGSTTEIEQAQNRYSEAQRGRTCWTARIGGAEFPVEAFGVEPADNGGMLVSMVVAADSVSIGDPSSGSAAPEVRPVAPVRRGWGAPGPDPRAGIPGWTPAEATNA